MKKIFLILCLFIFLFCGISSAELIIALKQTGDDILVTVKDNKEEYNCNVRGAIGEDGNVSIEITCCSCEGECIEIKIPTNKTGM